MPPVSISDIPMCPRLMHPQEASKMRKLAFAFQYVASKKNSQNCNGLKVAVLPMVTVPRVIFAGYNTKLSNRQQRWPEMT